MVDAGTVRVGGTYADKPARLVDPAEPIEVDGPPPRFVGRGGEKLDAALDAFGVDPAGRSALDAGASTGGFTDCLLQRGAVRVVALDVGHGQLHERLRADPRVVNLERTNVRTVTPADLPGAPFDLVVADLSFISLATVAQALVGVASPGADMVVLVKPQFEAGRAEVGAGRGVVRDPAVWRRVLGEVASAWSSRAATMMGVVVSPLRGADGNVEFVAHLVVGGDPAGAVTADDLDAVVELAAVGAATQRPAGA